MAEIFFVGLGRTRNFITVECLLAFDKDKDKEKVKGKRKTFIIYST
jgi:hypothetical protein